MITTTVVLYLIGFGISIEFFKSNFLLGLIILLFSPLILLIKLGIIISNK